MVVDLCKRELDEMFEEGVNYFNLFAEFVFDIYSEVDSKADKLYEQSEEEHFRFFELRRFIKKDMFDDFLVVYITRIGTSGLIEVDQYQPDHQEKAQRSKTQRLFRAHAHADPRERPHHEHHRYTLLMQKTAEPIFMCRRTKSLSTSGGLNRMPTTAHTATSRSTRRSC